MSMDPKQMAEIVGATVRGMIDEVANTQAAVNEAQEVTNRGVQDALDAIVGFLGEINEAVGVLNGKVDNPAAVVMTPEQIEEQRVAYRGQIVMEAARLGITPGEVARAKKALVP